MGVPFVIAGLFMSIACAHPPQGMEITRERAIEIARPQARFAATSIDVVKATVRGRPIWRVTLRGSLPGQPPGLFETRVVEIDRRSGEIVSVART